MTARRGAALAVTLGIAAGACAGTRVPVDGARTDGADAPARALAIGGLRAWIVRGDPAAAERGAAEALRRDPADPWAHAASALLARRHLDESGEAAQLIALLADAPGDALAPFAAARLQQLATVAPPLATAIDAGLERAQPRLRGVAALRTRLARAAALSALGAWDRAEAQRRDAGAVTAWTLAGPFGALHALDLDAPFPPERGALPADVPGDVGMPPVPSRAIPCPDGTLTLDGEPAGGDVFYIAAEATVGQGGDYLLSVVTAGSALIFVDGALVAERRAHAGFPPGAQLVPLRVDAGRHGILVKLARGGTRGSVAVAMARADGAPSDVAFSAVTPGASIPPARSGGRMPRPVHLPAEQAAALARDAGAEVSSVLVGREVMDTDREAAKVLVSEALVRAPTSPALLALRAALARDDGTLAPRVARARAEADLDRALALDPADAGARVARAELAAAGERYDQATELLDALPEADAARPRALVARARVARARGLATVAERLADEARRTAGDCAALDLLFGLAARRDSVVGQDELAEALARCPGGLEEVADHRRRRGDLAGAVAALDGAVRTTPVRIDARLARASALAAAGRPRDAAEDLARLASTWPRDARVEKRRAEVLEAGGDPAGAAEARRRALLLDPADLALRRAVALERGAEPLDEVAEDGLDAIARYRAAAPAFATSSVTVLDFGAVEAHAGGAYTERVHTVVEARDQGAVDHVGEVAIPPGAELLVARTVKRDGTVLNAEDPLGDKRTLSLHGLEPGDCAEWEWIRTVPARGPALPGFTADAFFFRADMPLWRSTYVVSAPTSLGLELDAHHMGPVEVRHDADRLLARVTRENVPALLPEPNAPGDAEELPFVQAGAGAGTEAFARAMGDALLDAFRPSLEIAALAEEIRSSVHGDDRGAALVRAAYRRVDALVLGSGGFDEPAGWILSRGRGNRTVVLKAVLDALHVKARVALVREVTRDPALYRFPRPDRHAYAVLRVEHAGRTVWLDPTTRGTPFGALPDTVSDAEAIVLPGPGEDVEVTRTPPVDPREPRQTQVDVALDGEGGATVEGREEYRGMEGAMLRAALERLDAPARRQAVEQVLARSFRGPMLLGLDVVNEGAPEEPLVIRWRARVDRWARLEPRGAVVDVPLFPARLGARFLQRTTRETQLLVAADERTTTQLTVRAPAGWVAVARGAAEVTTRFGMHRREERADGPVLTRRDALVLRRGRVAPAEYAEFAAFARAVDGVQQEPLRFERPTSVTGP